MRWPAVAILLLLPNFAFLGTSPAIAGGCGSSDVSVGTGSSDFQTSVEEQSGGCDEPTTNSGSGSSEPTHDVVITVCADALQGNQTCDQAAHCPDGTPETHTLVYTESGALVGESSNCPSDPTAPPGPSVADIVTAFRRIPLPRSTLQIQPPDGETLVNFTTNFLTEAEAFSTSVTLIGHRVDFRITPSRFRWSYGDGSGATTAKPGARYPTMGVTHVYRKRGAVKAAVDTTWSADYRVDGGGWAAVPDTVTIAGAAQALTVRSATPLLAGADR